MELAGLYLLRVLVAKANHNGNPESGNGKSFKTTCSGHAFREGWRIGAFFAISLPYPIVQRSFESRDNLLLNGS